jgi:hypothetical protein
MLTYELDAYMPGLDETVQLVKTPHRAFALRPDDSSVSLPALRELNRAAYRHKYGPLLRGFHARLTALPHGATEQAAIYFRPALDWSELAPRLFSRDGATQGRAQADLTAANERSTDGSLTSTCVRGFAMLRSEPTRTVPRIRRRSRTRTSRMEPAFSSPIRSDTVRILP